MYKWRVVCFRNRLSRESRTKSGRGGYLYFDLPYIQAKQKTHELNPSRWTRSKCIEGRFVFTGWGESRDSGGVQGHVMPRAQALWNLAPKELNWLVVVKALICHRHSYLRHRCQNSRNPFQKRFRLHLWRVATDIKSLCRRRSVRPEHNINH